VVQLLRDPGRQGMIAFGNFLFRYRNSLFPLTCALLLLPGTKLFERPLLAAGIGAVIALAGQIVRVVTIGLTYIVRGGRGGQVYAEDLVTEGVYALCRNPMYVGNVLLVVGIAVASNSVITLFCALPLVLFAYSAIVAAEEHYLRRKFGTGFETYCRDVPRWLPRLSALRQAFASGTFHWRRVIVKEYGTPFGWINVLCAITLYRLWLQDRHDFDASAQLLILAMVSTTMLWAAARVLKKTKRLVAD
jgi:protein-S-isoprenylcysteine O-methyltransferase Ste14